MRCIIFFLTTLATCGLKLPASDDIQQLVDRAKRSVVQITFTGRDGQRQGLGTGFIIAENGLIATNLHVIGEARPITVELWDKRRLPVSVVHASDRPLDLALLKVDADNLPALRLGESSQVKDGQNIIVLGNPLGLKHSVVTGVVSGRREIDNRRMLQIAMPVEPGNSGGPVLDPQGRVLGVVTMKSAITRNLGFAVEIDQLKPLIAKPNPVPISNWLTIGALDRTRWTPLPGGLWKQQAGQIVASGSGEDPVGRRMLCISKATLPKKPCEIAVLVRLDDEAGAAGLVFRSDGGERNYGFYPSRGRLRLSRFDGPSVFQWNVLYESASSHYRPGAWNHLKVRLEKDRFICYINDHKIFESSDRGLPEGSVGLAKFREHDARFRGFQIAARIPPFRPDPKVSEAAAARVDKLPPLAESRRADLLPLTPHARIGAELLRERARQLESRAGELKKLANDIHLFSVVSELRKSTSGDDTDIDLLRAGLLIAKLDNQELDPRVYVEQVEGMADAIRRQLPEKATESQKIDALNRYLFQQNGFHGSRTNYYHRANSYLNQVLDDREGLPITLSVLYIELGRRLGLRIEGVGLPGHFVVRTVGRDGKRQLVDVFDGAKLMTEQDAARIVSSLAGRPLVPADLVPSSRREILLRMLNNLAGIAQREGDRDAMLRYYEAMLAVDPQLVRERGLRAVLRMETGRRDAAVADLDWFLETKPEGVDLQQIRVMREAFLKQ